MLEAPERIETGWWDGDDTRRDYAVAELDGGQRAWLFRTIAAGIAPCTQSGADASQGWMLQGWFA